MLLPTSGNDGEDRLAGTWTRFWIVRKNGFLRLVRQERSCSNQCACGLDGSKQGTRAQAAGSEQEHHRDADLLPNSNRSTDPQGCADDWPPAILRLHRLDTHDLHRCPMHRVPKGIFCRLPLKKDRMKRWKARQNFHRCRHSNTCTYNQPAAAKRVMS
jgi:hypothetical protein